MAQNVIINGDTYPDVPQVNIPKPGGGNAVFMDTSDATASASDIAEGQTAYVNGQKVVGTGQPGGGVVITETTDSTGGTNIEIEVKRNITLVSKTVSPSTSNQTYSGSTESPAVDGFSNFTVNAITGQLLASLDADFVASNIKKDVNLFGVIGTYESGGGTGDYNVVSVDNGDGTQTVNITGPGGSEFDFKLQTKTATPSSSSQIISADSGYDGLSSVTVNPIPNLQTFYTGSSAPSSSLGNDGDIYFQVVS